MADPKQKLLDLLEKQRRIIEAQKQASALLEKERADAEKIKALASSK
jgi:hypothetical protein